MAFLVLFLIPVIVLGLGTTIVSFFGKTSGHKIDWQEFLLMLAAQAALE